MRVERGDLWDYHARGWHVVVTTNIGWDRSGRNNMGAGMALQAALRWPGLPLWYGLECRKRGAETPVLVRDDVRLVFFPVKPLLEANPELTRPIEHQMYLRDVVFTTGIVDSGDHYVVASGEADLACRITHIPKAEFA